jgi:hypothetical protein
MPNWINNNNNNGDGDATSSKTPRKRWEIEDKKSIKSKFYDSSDSFLSPMVSCEPSV